MEANAHHAQKDYLSFSSAFRKILYMIAASAFLEITALTGAFIIAITSIRTSADTQFIVASILVIFCTLPSISALYFIIRETKKLQKIYEVQLIRIVQLEASSSALRASSSQPIFVLDPERLVPHPQSVNRETPPPYTTTETPQTRDWE